MYVENDVSSRNLSLDVLRILACLAVIMIHTAGSPIVHGMVQPHSIWYAECLILDAFSRWSVPVFVMLTGFFMLDPQKKITIKMLFGKYILRLVTALLFWSVFYAVTLHKAFYPLGTQEGHFWYVGMCIGLYISLPVLRWIAQKPKLLAYFCWFWLFYMVYSFVDRIVVMPIDFGDVIFIDYVGYCFWGYYLKTILLTKRQESVIYLIGLIGLFVTITMGLVTQNNNTIFFGYMSPNVIAFSFSIFLFVIRHPINAGKRVSNIVQTCSQCTFGIYLIHLWILIQIFFRFHRYIPQPLPLCLLCILIAFVTGYSMVLIIKKIPFINRYIV